MKRVGIDLKYNKKPSDQTLSKDALYVSEKAMGKIEKEEIKAPSKEDFEKKLETSKMKSKSEHTALIFSKYGLLERIEFHGWKSFRRRHRGTLQKYKAKRSRNLVINVEHAKIFCAHP